MNVFVANDVNGLLVAVFKVMSFWNGSISMCGANED